jgi:hypothetical protein
MAFCNSCGAPLEAGTKFCNKCGVAAPAASGVVPAATQATAAPGAPAQKSGNALKIILIIVAVVVGLGIIGIGTTAFLIKRAISRTHIQEKNGKVKIESPILNMETSTDPDEAAKNLGVDLYPGAQFQKNGSASMTIAGMHTNTAVLESDDPPEKVAAFYKEKLPNTSYSANQGNHYSMMAGDKDDMTTNIEPRDTGSMIQISRVTKAGSE